MRLYLVRHGETDWNKKRLLQGTTDIPLNENGKQVALLTAEGLQGITFDKAYSSPLSRAYETAQLISGGRCPILTDPRITEIAFGIYEGYCCRKEQYEVPDPAFIYFFTDPSRYQPPQGAESVAEVCVRTRSFLEELAADPKNQDKAILIASHGSAIRSMLVWIQNIPLRDFWKGGVHRNCGVTIVDVTDGVFTVEKEDEIFYEESLSTNYFEIGTEEQGRESD